MKRCVWCILLLAPWLGCSPDPAGEQGSSVPVEKRKPKGRLPFEVTWIETVEEKEKHAIQQQAKALFSARDFEKLDALAQKYRDSKECYANGVWKLNEIHVGLQLPRNASERAWKAHLSALREWSGARPESITARVKLAEELVSYAWRARGGGYANTVSQEDWKTFHTHLKQAADLLAAAKGLKAKCPRWWSAMLQVAQGLGAERSDYEEIFNEAVRANPQYAVYYSRKSTYLLPRWHGKPGEWERFLASTADQIGGEDGDVLYARVAWLMHESVFGNIFEESKISWNRVESGFKVLEARFPTSLAVRNERAYLAIFACQRPVARKYFERLDGKVDLSVWPSKENFIEKANWVFAK